MTEQITIHPTHPQARLIKYAVSVIEQGGIVVYPTDSAYALGCQIGNKAALERIRRLRQLDKTHNFTLICRDLSEIALFARVDNPSFRFLKSYTPGPYTFILPATKEVPKMLQHAKRKTIGIRVPDHPIVSALLDELGASMMSVSLLLPGQEVPLVDVDEMYEKLDGQVDLIIDGGFCGIEPTTVIELTTERPEILRIGKGFEGTDF